MKIALVSDTHKKHMEVDMPQADLLLLAGDYNITSLADLVNFNDWLGSIKSKYEDIIVVGGNHDFYLENNYAQVRATLTNAKYLENNFTSFKKIKIYGSPITPKYMHWAFMAERGKYIKKYWDMIPLDTDILITHGPPYNILDSVVQVDHDHNTRKMNLGCKILIDKVRQIKPKLHVFGHIHYSYGVEKNHKTTFVNASVVNEAYKVVNKPIVVEI